MIDIVGLYDAGVLLEASFAGIGFWIADSRSDGGLRVQKFLFPGQDQADFQILGADDGEIRITGLYVGDDYVDVAAQLRAAFQTPAPQTLVHPWLGELLVIQAPGRRPEISFKQDELRVVRISASFCPYSAPQPPAADTLSVLLSSLDDVRSAAEDVLDAILAPAIITVLAVGYVESFCAAIASAWSGLLAGAIDVLIAPAAAVALAVLQTANSLALAEGYAAAIAAALGGVSTVIAGTTTPVKPAAVAPGGSVVPPVPVDGRITTNLILSAAATMAAHSTDGAPGPMVCLAAQMLALADAVAAASDIAFDSQQDAMQWQATLTAALDTAATQAAALAPAQPTAAGGAWRVLVAAESALAADMTATIGRLPAVTTFTSPVPVPVWVLALYLSGDNPGQMLATYLDLVRRNGIVNPAIAPAGKLEVLLAA